MIVKQEGNMLFSKRDLTKIILPLILQQILGLAIGTVDSMMVAHAGEAAVSGVSLVASLDSVLMLVFNAMVNGGAVVVSQALGKKNPDGARAAAKQLFWVVTVISTVLTASVLTFRLPLLNTVFGDVDPEVMHNAQGYFLFIAMSFPFIGISNVNDAMFRTMGNSMVSLAASLGMNLLHLGLNAALIIGFGMGAVGAAISTLISRFLCAAALTVLLHNPRYTVCFQKLLHFKPDFRIIRSILRIGVPNGFESGMVELGRLILQTLVAPMGTAVIAANAVANTMVNYQYVVGTVFQSTVVTVVGRCIGAGEKAQAKYYSRRLLLMNYIGLWLVAAVSALIARPFIGIYNLSDTAAETARQLVLYHCVLASVLWPCGFTLPVVFRSAGDVHFPLIVSTVSMWVLRIGLGHIFALESVSVFGFTLPGLGLGVMGTWMAMSADWLLRASLYAIRYFCDRWLPPHMREKSSSARFR